MKNNEENDIQRIAFGLRLPTKAKFIASILSILSKINEILRQIGHLYDIFIAI